MYIPKDLYAHVFIVSIYLRMIQTNAFDGEASGRKLFLGPLFKG